jgi:hypothetical protein
METVDLWVTRAVAAWPLIVILAGLIYPFLPGPVRAWLLAAKAKAASDTHVNDTALLLGTLWRGYQAARLTGATTQTAMSAALVYVGNNRPDLVGKLSATPVVMVEMLSAAVKDHDDARAAGLAVMTEAKAALGNAAQILQSARAIGDLTVAKRI